MEVGGEGEAVGVFEGDDGCAGCVGVGDGGGEAEEVGEGGLGEEAEVVDVGGPVGAAAGIADDEDGCAVIGGGDGEDGWDGDGGAVVDDGDALCGGDADAGAAVAAGAAADEDLGDFEAGVVGEELLEGWEDAGVVAAIAAEGVADG